METDRAPAHQRRLDKTVPPEGDDILEDAIRLLTLKRRPRPTAGVGS